MESQSSVISVNPTPESFSKSQFLSLIPCSVPGLALYSFDNHFEEIEGLLVLSAVRNDT
jgi:hypothetical protein